MSTAKKLALIAAGYALSVAGGLVAVAVNELLIGEEVAQTSGGMVAFGDMVLFLFVAGALGLAPTLLLLKLSVEKAPRAVLAAELLLAAIGPLSWLAVIHLTEPASSRRGIARFVHRLRCNPAHGFGPGPAGD
jgi:hypothetical protein